MVKDFFEVLKVWENNLKKISSKQMYSHCYKNLLKTNALPAF